MIETPGSILKSARKNRDWTIDKVADRLKLAPEKVQAIENDNFISFHSDVFVIGLLRRYANILKIESDYIILLYNRDFKKDLVKKDLRRKNLEEAIEEKTQVGPKVNMFEKILNRRLILVLASILILIFFGFNVSKLITNSLNPPILKITVPVTTEAPSELTYVTEENTLIVRGETGKNTVVKINSIPVNVKTGLNFESDPLPITSEENVINIEATNNLGIKTNIKLTVQRIFKKLDAKEGN